MDAALNQSTLRVGKISFLNTLPFFTGWEGDGGTDWQFVEGVPTELNAKLLSGEIDAGIASSLAYAADPEKLQILPGFCIGAQGKSHSVMFYSDEPFERLNQKTVHLSSKSLSAATLLKILLKLKYGFENTFITSGDPAAEARNYLLIGDEALFHESRLPHAYDLSQAWHEWTGLPFCFALWTVRRESFSQNKELFARFAARMTQRLERNLEKIPRLAALSARDPERKKIVTDYLHSLKYYLRSDIERGLKLFYRYAADIGAAPRDLNLSYCEF